MEKNSDICGNESMRPVGAAIFRGSGDVLAGGAPMSASGPRGHFCQLPKGHEGAHACEYIQRAQPELGVGQRYTWEDERQLICHPFYVRLKPPSGDVLEIVPWPTAAEEEAMIPTDFTRWNGGSEFPLPVDTKAVAIFRNSLSRSLFQRELRVCESMYPESWRHTPGFDPIVAYRTIEAFSD